MDFLPLCKFLCLGQVCRNQTTVKKKMAPVKPTLFKCCKTHKNIKKGKTYKNNLLGKHKLVNNLEKTKVQGRKFHSICSMQYSQKNSRQFFYFY